MEQSVFASDPIMICLGHQNAQEIHPAHSFLAVPDQRKRLDALAKANSAGRTAAAPPKMAVNLRHPEAFCHK